MLYLWFEVWRHFSTVYMMTISEVTSRFTYVGYYYYYYYASPHTLHKTRAIATDGVSWLVGLWMCVCRFFGHVREHCENGWTNWDAVWWQIHAGTRNHVLDGANVGRVHSLPRGITRLRCGLSSKFFDQLLQLHVLLLHWPNNPNSFIEKLSNRKQTARQR